MSVGSRYAPVRVALEGAEVAKWLSRRSNHEWTARGMWIVSVNNPVVVLLAHTDLPTMGLETRVDIEVDPTSLYAALPKLERSVVIGAAAVAVNRELDGLVDRAEAVEIAWAEDR